MENALGLNDKGILRKIKNAVTNMGNNILDGILHVNTTKGMLLAEHDNKVNYMYEPFPYIKMRRLFKNYSFSGNEGFVDIGCGKGRVLVGAALSGCKNVYGVDISPKLLEFAEKNMSECKKKIAGLNYKLLCIDARDYVFSHDINNVFFYNPFSYRIFLQVIKSLKKSIEESPREVTIFLAGPERVSRYLVDDKDFTFLGIDQNNVYIYRHFDQNKECGCGGK